MSGPAMTVANQEAMQQQLKALASSHKKAKLQELFKRHDSLRQGESRSSKVADKAEIEAMKSQFNDLQKEQLTKQITKQFDLRVSEVLDGEKIRAQLQLKAEAEAEAEPKAEEEPEAEAEPEPEQDAEAQLQPPAQSGNLYGYKSDGSGDQKIDTEDVEAMKAEFGKYQKKLLQKQFEKSFRLRVPNKKKITVDDQFDYSLSADEDGDEDKDEVKKTEEEEKEFIEMKRKESIIINEQYNAMNKAMLSLRSTKTLERIQPQIKPEHKERFEILMQDIGIINQSIIDKLWGNIEDVVGHEKVIDEVEEIENEDDFLSTSPKEQDTKDTVIKKLKKENEILQQKIEFMQQQLAPVDVVQRLNDEHTQNDADAEDEDIDAAADGQMVIIN